MWGLCNYRLAGCTIFSLMSYRHWVQKASQGRGRVPALHCPTPTRFWQDSIPSFLPLLTQCIFMTLLSIECLSIHLQWCATPHARMEDASYITSEELNWSKEPIISCSPFFPTCLTAPFLLKLTVTYKLQILELFMQSILKRYLVFFSQRSTLCYLTMASVSNNKEQ